MDINIKPRSLRFAPVWKRILAYFVDSSFLMFFLSLLIALMYRDDLQLLYKNVREIGGLNLLVKEGLFPQQIEYIKQVPKDLQDLLYIQNFLSIRYYYLIFVYFQILSISYYAFFWHFTGQTLGAVVLNIRVIAEDVSRPSLSSCILRSMILRLYEALYYLPALPIFMRSFKYPDSPIKNFPGRLHDRLSGTVVIDNKEWLDTMQDLQKIIEEKLEELNHGQTKKEKD